ncbi:MAG: hypothetical protein KatS3mg068_0643 [Candidatus Sericytochromatia bacterium]|nr:MAG: hypothetical protein KatS3mg068_0643 [Candidatus Sericytochromatia bacterium]
MKKFYLMLSSLISFSFFVSTLSGCGNNRPSQATYNVASVNSPNIKSCGCKKNNSNNNSNNNIVESSTPTPSIDSSVTPSPSISSSPEPSESPTPLPSSSSNPSKDKDKKNLFSNLIEKFKNIFKKPSK